MERRTFLLQGSLITSTYIFQKLLPFPTGDLNIHNPSPEKSLYNLFKSPPNIYRPFVRWWWNGNKVEASELFRELRVIKEAGFGGVEINPIKFPERTNDLNIPSLKWLSSEWIDLLQKTFNEAASLGLTCDLIVGSGWPFGAEWLEGEERSQIIVIGIKKLEGPMDYEVSLFELLKEADPTISSPYHGKNPELLSIQLAPDPLTSLNEVKDLTGEIEKETIVLKIPKGKYVLYSLVKINGFMEVINGAPGANGPVLNHYNEAAVRKYLSRMVETIQQKTGPLSKHIRALFIDSLELEGANWCSDMEVEFKKRRGYDLFPYLPYILFKIEAMGNTLNYNYGAELSSEFSNMIQRMRYDFELTKTELLQERFQHSFLQWCKQNNVRSRMQAYGRGYFLLDGSLDVDLPECETWIRYGIGIEMSEENSRLGRAYTMINKYVSSAAHLKAKKYISAEELTDIDMVFNETLEICKIAADQSTVSGVTHAIFHGFNYSPPVAQFPGWVRYGTFLNERNTWWPYIRYLTDYRARIAAILQQATMFADIAVLPPIPDMWSLYGAQNEPFPITIHPPYQTLIWETIHQNGHGCDIISEQIISDATMHERYLHYGLRKYHSIFLIKVESMEPKTAEKLFEFVLGGGRVFCIESYPDKSPGWYNHEHRDEEVRQWINKMKNYPDRFILLQKPEKNFIEWFNNIQHQHHLNPYVKISEPNRFVSQIRYQTDNSELLFFINSSMDDAYVIDISFLKEILDKKQGWVWDAETGKRYLIELAGNKFKLDLGPADAKLIVFDHNKKGDSWKPKPTGSPDFKQLRDWRLESKHINGSIIQMQIDELKDLKDISELMQFSGTVIYRTTLQVKENSEAIYLNLGKVYGVSELSINGLNCGVQWYGRRIYSVRNKIKPGANTIEIKVVTSMGNYLKSLKDNPVAQYWTNEKRKDQPIQSMGLIGPVTFY